MHIRFADIFVLNQFAASEGKLSHTWWTETLAGVVAEIGHTVVVLLPWRQPVPLGRSWCLWELFSTLTGRSILEIALTPVEEASFNAAMVSSSPRSWFS